MKKVERASGAAPTFWRHLTNMARPRRSRLKEELIWREYEDEDEDFDHARPARMSFENMDTLSREAEKEAMSRAWADRFEAEEMGGPIIRPADAASDSNVPGMLVDRKV